MKKYPVGVNIRCAFCTGETAAGVQVQCGDDVLNAFEILPVQLEVWT